MIIKRTDRRRLEAYLLQAVSEMVGQVAEVMDEAGRLAIDRHNEAAIRRQVESVRVSFRTVDLVLKQAEELIGPDPTAADYEAVFLLIWRSRVPHNRRHIEGDPMVYRAIKDMGAKYKSLKAGICVAHTIGLPCRECYFRLPCRLKFKRAESKT
jgi:glutathione S-transferase